MTRSPRDPENWLGATHVATFGADTALLVKLLDAGQRLPVHCHPSNEFAAAHLDSRYGKTEAWIVVGTTGADPTVHIGFTRGRARRRRSPTGSPRRTPRRCSPR